MKLALVLSLLFLTAKSQAARTISKSIAHDDGDITMNTQNMNKNTLTYSVCDDVTKTTKKNCKVIHKVFNFDGTEETKSCDVSIEADQDKNVGKFNQVFPLDSNRAVLYSYDENKELVKDEKGLLDFNLKFFIVDLTDCSISQSNTPIIAVLFKEEYIPLTVNIRAHKDDDKFDVMYKSKKQCTEMCVVTMDSKGNLVNEPKEWIKERVIHYFNMEEIEEPKGVVVMRESFCKKRGRVKIFIIKDDQGDQQDLKSYQFGETARTSAKHDTISICAQLTNTSMECTRFNPLNLPEPVDVRSLTTAHHIAKFSIENYGKDGFLLATVECENDSSGKYDCSGEKGKFIVRKMSDDKKDEMLSLTLEGLSCKDKLDDLTIDLFENNKDGFCLSRVCKRTGNINYEVRCFRLEDLK